MKIVAQFDTMFTENYRDGVPVTGIFSPDNTLDDIVKWIRGNTGRGSFIERMSDIRLSIVEE